MQFKCQYRCDKQQKKNMNKADYRTIQKKSFFSFSKNFSLTRNHVSKG